MSSFFTSERIRTATQITAIITYVLYICSQVYVLSIPIPQTPKSYCPNYLFIAAFFGASTVLNVQWLTQLLFPPAQLPQTPTLPSSEKHCSEPVDAQTHILPEDQYLSSYISETSSFVSLIFDYSEYVPSSLTSVPVLASLAWIKHYPLASDILLVANLCAQFYFISGSKVKANVPSTSHIVSRMNAGLGVLYLWRNWGILNRMPLATIRDRLNTGVILVLMAYVAGPDPTLGLCLLYDLAALRYGEAGNDKWQQAFLWTATAVGAGILIDLVSSHGRKIKELSLEVSRYTSDLWKGEQPSITPVDNVNDAIDEVHVSRNETYPFSDRPCAPLARRVPSALRDETVILLG